MIRRFFCWVRGWGVRGWILWLIGFLIGLILGAFLFGLVTL